MRRNPGEQSQSDEPLTIDQIRLLVERARGGDATSLDPLRTMFDEHPDVWQQYSDLARHISDEFVKQISSNDLCLSESLPRRLAAMKLELTGPTSTPLEKLLVERIISSWLVVCYAEVAVAHQGDVSIRLATFNTKRLDQAHRRYLAALKTLATVRKLLPPQSGQPGDRAVDKGEDDAERDSSIAPLRVRPRIKPRREDLSDSSSARSGEVLDPLKLKAFAEIKLDARSNPNNASETGD